MLTPYSEIRNITWACQTRVVLAKEKGCWVYVYKMGDRRVTDISASLQRELKHHDDE